MTQRGWLFYGGRLLDAPRAAKSGARAGSGVGSGVSGRSRAARWKGAGSEAVLVLGGLIEAVGPLRDLKRRAGRGVEPVDLKGGTLTPGFADAHIHPLSWIRAIEDPWIKGTQSIEGLERAVRSAGAKPKAEWLTVRGWVPREWSGEARRRATLDSIEPDRPLVVYAVDGHSVWVNTAALHRAGVPLAAADPLGGVVEREPSGEPTGVLIETAADWIHAHVRRAHAPSQELQRAIRRIRSLGVTSVHSFDRASFWVAAQDLERAGRLGLRVLLSVPVSTLGAAESLGLRAGFGSPRLRVGPVKMFADGTLGSSTALLEDPYEGKESRGLMRLSPDELGEGCLRAARAGLSVAIHAIGDRAVRNALDAIQSALARGARFPVPPRIEHIQLIRTEDLVRFRSLGVVASVQPIHQATDAPVARRLWGSRTERSYAWRSLLRAGARLAFGSDAPFDRPGPLLGIQAALLRRGSDEPRDRAFHPEQRLTLTQALRAHLEEPHRLADWGVSLGRITARWGADLVRFDHDLLALRTEELHEARVRGVWVEGHHSLL